jgi:hypothetical protein
MLARWLVLFVTSSLSHTAANVFSRARLQKDFDPPDMSVVASVLSKLKILFRNSS